MNDTDRPDLPSFSDIYLDLEQSYRIGNKAALYDAVARYQKTGKGLPEWAAVALKDIIIERWKGKTKTWNGTDPNQKDGYKKILSRYVRSEVYRSIMLWHKNKRHYKTMPSSCIQDWYDRKLNTLSSVKEEAALQMTLKALKGTIAGGISDTTLKEDRYHGAFEVAEKQDFDDPEMATFLEMSNDEYRSFMTESYRDTLREAVSFGYNESEVLFGFRPAGQFWGPPCPPPDHIQKILDAEPLLKSDK